MTALRIALILIAAAIIGALSGYFLSAKAFAGTKFGFNDDPPALLHHVPEQQSMGANVARTPLVGWMVDRGPGFHWWVQSDAIYEDHLAAGITPIFVVYGAPEWATTSSGAPAEDWWTEFLTAVATRYPRAHLQLLNEPNQPAFGTLSVPQVVRLVQLGARAVHAVNPTQTVIGPPPSPGMKDWRPYLRRIYVGLRHNRVHASIHLYAYGNHPVRFIKRQYRRLDRVTPRPIWVTETGASAGMYPGARQARVTLGIRRYLTRARARAVVLHRLQEPAPLSNWEATARLWALNRNGSPSLLGAALQSAHRRPD